MDTLFMEYEYTLIGRADNIKPYNFYGAASVAANQRRALSCVKYAIERVLQWTPEEAVQKFDRYMIQVMKLDKIVDHIKYPDEIEDGDPRYILSLIYPEKVKIKENDLVINTFKRVITTGCQFPREYFSGLEGFHRYCICLKYLLYQYHPVSSTPEIYEFLDSAAGKALLFDLRLKIPGEMMNIDLYDCVRNICPPDGADFYCSLYKFKRQMKEKRQKEAETF